MLNEAEAWVRLRLRWSACGEEVVAPRRRRGKRKRLSAELPRLDVIHELPERLRSNCS